ncbi:MAG: aldolase [Acidobacteria bacterium]|jgi:L-fuculose-phosphate aldolase|nr:aldolase [Acidobacteriota bacterium]MBQ01625.1 aldolase [Acidobacteriota bacterium]MDP7480742.1 class II aldolase/adducin family protein [Vicinamibacterales bacterium]MDP7690583.1 class II aldolase/adducin family protein [Vicinamibacterales bacterium]HJN45622.1 class II aldolase/adducin family protein [Vicinamibacterales bacterium]|tara:strand:- start:43 stop:963 length:921 start_codon:yes stop_codon:yes gene_type:complete
MQTEERLRADIVEVGRRLHERGFVASNDGNISVRLEGDRLLTTPTGVSKGFMTPDMMVTTDLAGGKLTGEREPSSEILMHLAVYENRPEIKAVVHAHPPTATGFAVAGIPLDRAVLAEVVTTLGSIPIADYGTPSTSELADAVRQYIRAHDGLLLANHGALTVADELFAAYYKMETVEHFARISLVARQLGRERLLSREEVNRLQDLRDRYGIAAPAPICPTDPENGPDLSCQTLEAPAQPGEQVVDTQAVDSSRAGTRDASDESHGGSGRQPLDLGSGLLGSDEEIRLTYRELTALIADAVKQLQ